MGDDKRDRDTPVTGTAIPRPRLKRVEAGTDLFSLPRAVEAQPTPEPVPAEPPPPSNPTIEDVYRLIDRRLSPLIVQRISSAPPSATVELMSEPRPSMPVRAAKATGRWTKWAMAVLGVLTLVGEIWADVEKYRGPISQLLVFAAKQLDAHEAPELAPPVAE